MKVPENVPAAVSTRLMTSNESRGFFQIDHSGRPSARAAVARASTNRRQQINRFMERHSEKSMRLLPIAHFCGMIQASAHFPKSARHRRDTFSRTSESYGH